MSCSGLHCAGCAGGAAVPVVPLVAFCGLAWVAEHIVEVAIASGVSGALAVAAVVALMRWQDRRQARHAARSSLWTAREVPGAPAPAARQVGQVTPPAIVNNYGPQVHIYGWDGGESAARIVRQALTGQAGDAISSGEE
jgi:hypothetical protein